MNCEQDTNTMPPAKNCGYYSCCSEMFSTASITHLPDELLLKIFSYISINDLALNLSGVCLRWENLANDLMLWRRSRFVCDKNHPKESAVEIISRSPYLETLCIEHHEDVNEILSAGCQASVRVNVLVIKTWKSVLASLLQNVLKQCPGLVSLEVDGWIWFDIKAYQLVKQFGNLKSLSIPNCNFLNSYLLRKIMDECRFLEELNIAGADTINDDEVVYLVEMGKDKLISLVLGGRKLTDVGFSKLRELATLRRLGIEDCEAMTDRSLSSIANLHLTTLRLRNGVKLTSCAVAELISSATMSKLVNVDLSRCYQVGDEVAESLSRNCPLLQHVRFDWCTMVTRYGVECVISGCRHLKELHIMDGHSQK